jgi:hypothetical protein
MRNSWWQKGDKKIVSSVIFLVVCSNYINQLVFLSIFTAMDAAINGFSEHADRFWDITLRYICPECFYIWVIADYFCIPFLSSGGQFYWWWKPEYPRGREEHRPVASHCRPYRRFIINIYDIYTQIDVIDICTIIVSKFCTNGCDVIWSIRQWRHWTSIWESEKRP